MIKTRETGRKDMTLRMQDLSYPKLGCCKSNGLVVLFPRKGELGIVIQSGGLSDKGDEWVIGEYVLSVYEGALEISNKL